MLLEPATGARILKAFARMCAPIVFGAEKRVNPDSSMVLMYEDEEELRLQQLEHHRLQHCVHLLAAHVRLVHSPPRGLLHEAAG